MDKIKSLKVKQADGTFSEAIPFGADAVNVTMSNGSTIETIITNLQSNEMFIMEKSNLDVYQGRTIEFNLYNQELIDLITFCKEHQNDRDFNNSSITSYQPFSIIIGMMTDMGLFKKVILSAYYLEGSSIEEGIGYQRAFYFDIQDVMGSLALEDNETCRFMNASLVLGITDNIINNPTAYTTVSTFEEENVIRGYGNVISLAQTKNVYSKTEINNLIGDLSSLNIEIVATLPTENISTSTIYLLPIGAATTGTSSGEETTTAPNVYEEYLYINNAWELIGTTQVDLSGYVTTETFNTEIGSLGNQVGRAQSSADQALSQLENLEVEETEVAISATEPADEAKIWINPNEDATLTTLSEVAFTGDYNDLINIPSTDTSGGITESQVTEMINSATSNFITSGEVDTKISTATADLVTTSAISKMVTSNSVRRVEAVTEYPSNPEDGVLYIQIAS